MKHLFSTRDHDHPITQLWFMSLFLMSIASFFMRLVKEVINKPCQEGQFKQLCDVIKKFRFPNSHKIMKKIRSFLPQVM